MAASAQTIVKIAVNHHIKFILRRHFLAVTSLVCSGVKDDAYIDILQHGLVGCETVADAVFTFLLCDVVLKGTALTCLVDIELAVMHI